MSREKETLILRDAINAENLLGYKKKSFSLAYHGGEIWFEHLDGIYDHENLALKKLAEDTAMFARPSSPCDICFVFDETTVTDRMIGAVKKAILGRGKRFMKIAFAGLAPKARRRIKKNWRAMDLASAFSQGWRTPKNGF
ncbi:MAG: hypothetical protein PUC57_07675 [Oscillospiraceae bacterium]|nr:hypothetical protein [Oscillospiraceae bacterium]